MAFRNDDPTIASIEIAALDGSVVHADDAHIRPVNMSRFDIHGDTVGMPAISHENSLFGAVGFRAKHEIFTRVQNEYSAL